VLSLNHRGAKLTPQSDLWTTCTPFATSGRWTHGSATLSIRRDVTPEIYVSTDVEADGPIPGPNSMLSFASAAFSADKELIGTFSRNIETLPGASPDPKTEAWWQTQPDAWTACRKNLRAPAEAMHEYVGYSRITARRQARRSRKR